MTPLIPLTQDLVLIGGGHAHALVLRMWGMNPLPGVRVTVINPGPTAPYTGMLPGFVAGHYTRDELDIDLVKLCRFAGARLILGKAEGIDRSAKTITVAGRPPIAYDVASIDIGIHSQMPEIEGFADHGIAAKPLDVFARKWDNFVSNSAQSVSCAVIGGGIAGVELAMAMAHRLGDQGQVSIIEAQPHLTGINPRTLRRLLAQIKQLGIQSVVGQKVVKLESNKVILEGSEVPSTFTVGAAGARPHPWLEDTDLPQTEGYITVTEDLSVQGDPDLFAAGDCAHMSHAPRPKAGVFAVRSAPVLLENLKARLSGQTTKPFHPQKTYLKLISLGGKAAIAEKGNLSFGAPMMWRWKDQIDRKFMDHFRDLPVMDTDPLPVARAIGVDDALGGKPLCGGCGAKVGSDVLECVLDTIAAQNRTDVISQPGDDAAVLKFGSKKQVITVDHLRAFDEDPYRMARIATVHALGDVWAMGADPQALLVSLTLPRLDARLQQRTLAEVMRGIDSISAQIGAEVVGGHTAMGAEMSIGLTVTGLLPKGREAITIAGAKAGDALILTRPIGSGTLLAAEMAGKAKGADIAALLDRMQRPQSDAAALLTDAHAMTDVTGFGLAGHLHRICKASGLGAEVNLSAIPVYDGAIEMNLAGVYSSIYPQNRLIETDFDGLTGPISELIFDPQTAGGLLAAVPSDQADQTLSALCDAGHTAAIIGKMTEGARITCLAPDA